MDTTRSIAQIWRGVTRASEREACVASLLARIQAALADSATCKGAYLLTRLTNDAEVELMVLSLFGGAAGAACHDGEARYRTAVFDAPLPATRDRSIAVYEVTAAPRRMLLHANLRHRFPLRLMAPR